MRSQLEKAYKGKRVFVTGHTGFKGTWLTRYLLKLGATVGGYSLAPSTTPNHFDRLESKIFHRVGDLRDLTTLETAVQEFDPEIIFHMGAQPLVRLSYEAPLETFETNIMGSLNLYQSARKLKNLKAIVSITTDKVYDNKEWDWGYRENDRLGGKDPYSASKAAMEIVTESFKQSFYNLEKYGKDHQVLIATVRAGNVIGGGDWSQDRLIPDIAKATHEGRPVKIRNPNSTRPWQHVLEPLTGYLLLGEKLLQGNTQFAQSFNFGPMGDAELPVGRIVELVKKVWPKMNYIVEVDPNAPKEANLLRLDSTKAHKLLGFKSRWTTSDYIEKTIGWYKAFYETDKLLTDQQIEEYLS